MNPPKGKKLLREVGWIFLGFLPMNILVLLLLHLYFFVYTGTDSLSAVFSKVEIQEHDYYLVLDPIVVYTSIIVISFAFVYSVRMFLAKLGALPFNILALIMLLAADYYLYRGYAALIELANIVPIAYHDFGFIEYLFKGALVLTFVATVGIGMLLYRNHSNAGNKSQV